MSESGSEEDEHDFTELESTLEETANLIETMMKEVATLETRLHTIKRPIQDLHVEQLGELDFLSSSPFRQQEFKFAKPEVAVAAGLDPKKRHTFQKIAECLRQTLLAQKLVDEHGLIHLSKSLQKLFETKEDILSFPGLLGNLRAVLV